MKFAFGYGFDSTDIAGFERIAASADAGGLDMVMTGDTPALLGDVYVGMTLIAQQTRRCKVASFVTNPVTRHPVVTAAAIGAVEAISGGRAVLGISTGDSGVYNLGRRPATQRMLADYVATLRSLWDTGEGEYEGRPVQFTWSRGRVPVFMAPGGPKGLELAGRVADGVIIETGFLPEVVADSLGHLQAGARAAGRHADDIEVWWHARAAFGSSAADAAHTIRSGLAGIANRVLRFSSEGKLVPDDLVPRFEELIARYAILHHEEHGERLRNASLLEELGLLDYVAERFGILGTPTDWIARLRELEALGVRNVAFAGLMPDKQGFIETFARDVMPALTATGANGESVVRSC